MGLNCTSEPRIFLQQVPFERRSNRVTSASWHFESGALGTLVHTKVLHEQSYFTEMEILADGLHIVLGAQMPQDHRVLHPAIMCILSGTLPVWSLSSALCCSHQGFAISNKNLLSEMTRLVELASRAC